MSRPLRIAQTNNPGTQQVKPASPGRPPPPPRDFKTYPNITQQIPHNYQTITQRLPKSYPFGEGGGRAPHQLVGTSTFGGYGWHAVFVNTKLCGNGNWLGVSFQDSTVSRPPRSAGCRWSSDIPGWAGAHFSVPDSGGSHPGCPLAGLNSAIPPKPLLHPQPGHKQSTSTAILALGSDPRCTKTGV